MRDLVAEAGLADRIEVDSAGTGGWHVGQPADAARGRGRARAGHRPRRARRASSRPATSTAST